MWRLVIGSLSCLASGVRRRFSLGLGVAYYVKKKTLVGLFCNSILNKPYMGGRGQDGDPCW